MSGEKEFKPIGAQAREVTTRVEERIARELSQAGCSGLQDLMDMTGGMIFMAAQKLIDLKAKRQIEVPQHEAVVYFCSRLFNDCFAGYELAGRGLLLPAAGIIRSAFEVTTLGMLVMENEDIAKSWLTGDRISQARVRKLLKAARNEQKRYKFFSDRLHPTLLGVPLHTVQVEHTGAEALRYGGWAAPKSAGFTMCELLYAQIAFLEAFYRNFGEVLEEHDLLWTSDTKEILQDGKTATWDFVLTHLKAMVWQISDRLKSMPIDGAEFAKDMKPVVEAFMEKVGKERGLAPVERAGAQVSSPIRTPPSTPLGRGS